uniref:Secreted protein n=1 Tax=Setaria viridis TaxID=4556 RepID=A0A4U6TGX7_SETVI|nr:hypothetical protein SEVIR_8G191950v2 [Setaria viridis]
MAKALRNSLMICCSSVVVEAVSTMSSTQRSNHAVAVPHRRTNKKVSDLVATKPREKRCAANRW